MGRTVGIDLGTTISAVAVIGETGAPELLKNAEGERFTPSVIYFDESGPIVGREAKEMQRLGEEDVASFFKRAMGDRNWLFYAGTHTYTPTDLSSLVLKKLKADAEAALGERVTDAVITAPAYFSDLQRRNTIAAGSQAGLNVLRIINEPTAAAIAYGTSHTFESGAHVLVYDLGGGTFDVTLVQVTDDAINVLATDGNHELGGKDWDDTVLRYVAQQFEDEHGLDPLDDTESFNDLLVQAEQAKKKLSTTQQTIFPIVCEGLRGKYTLTRTTFEELTTPLMEMTLAKTEEVLGDAGIRWSDLDHLLCVGGSSRMPMVHARLQNRAGKAPLRNVDVDAVVAYGAAVQAHLDATPTYGLAGSSRDGRATGEALFLGPAKAVHDVMSHSLGMVAINEDRSRYINTILIPKNQSIPSREARPYQFRTSARRENEMEVYITQGESDHPLSCEILGKYRFTRIPHSSTEAAVLDITYAYDKNGVVQVSARHRESGQSITSVVESVPDDLSWMDEPPVEEEVVPEHVSLYLAIDLSGSMSGRPLREAKRAAKGLVQNMDLAHTSIGLIAVADRVKVVQKLCQNARKLKRAIKSLDIGDVGYGNDDQPFSKARQELRDRDGLRFMLVLADGVWTDQRRAIREAHRCHDAGVEVIAIGFGGADEAFLKAVASSEESALFTDLSNLASSFDRVAQVLTESGGTRPSAMTTAVADKPASRSRRGLLSIFK